MSSPANRNPGNSDKGDSIDDGMSFWNDWVLDDDGHLIERSFYEECQFGGESPFDHADSDEDSSREETWDGEDRGFIALRFDGKAIFYLFREECEADEMVEDFFPWNPDDARVYKVGLDLVTDANHTDPIDDQLQFTDDPHLLNTLDAHEDAVASIAFSSDGKLLASGCQGEKVRLWDPSTGTLVRTLAEGWLASLNSVSFSPDGRLLASMCRDKVCLSDPATGALVRSLSSSWPFSVGFSPDGKSIAIGCWPETIQIWGTESGKLRSVIEGHLGHVHAVAFSPDGRLLASGSRDRALRIWDVVGGNCVGALEGHSGSVNVLGFSPNGRILASGSSDRTVRIWDVSSGTYVRAFEGHTGLICSVAFSPDGRLLASGSSDQTIRVWDLSSGTLVRLHDEQTGHIAAFSPDGLVLAIGCCDGTVRLWTTA